MGRPHPHHFRLLLSGACSLDMLLRPDPQANERVGPSVAKSRWQRAAAYVCRYVNGRHYSRTLEDWLKRQVGGSRCGSVGRQAESRRVCLVTGVDSKQGPSLPAGAPLACAPWPSSAC